MPHSNIVEWVAGGTLPQLRRRKVRIPEGELMSKIRGRVTVEEDISDSSCCSTCSSCSSSCSVASVDFSSKKVHFKPKGILKNAKEVEKEDHKCCSACTLKIHCNERHAIGKNGKVYGSSKKCAPKDGRKEFNGVSATNSNSSNKARSSNFKNNNNSSKFSVSSSTLTNPNDIRAHRVEFPQSPPQTPEERRAAQHLGSLINRNMSRLILPSRAEVIIREDVLENPSDPRPNAFFDARTGILRVYHGPLYGNPSGSLVPLQAQHVPIGTTSAWSNPWAGMMNGMFPFGMNQRGGGGNFGQHAGTPGDGGYTSGNNSGNNNSNSSNQKNNSSGKPQASDTDAKGSSDDTGGSRRMPGSFHNDDDQSNGNSGWETANHSSDNKNSNDDAWGTGNDSANNNSSSNDAWPSGNGNSNEDQPADVWTGDADNNASSGNDDWGPGGNDSSNNNTNSSNDNEWRGNNNSNNNSSGWQSSNNNSNNNRSSPNNNYSNPTGTDMSAGSWGADNGKGPTAGGNGNTWSAPTNQASWGDASAAQSTRPTEDTDGW